MNHLNVIRYHLQRIVLLLLPVLLLLSVECEAVELKAGSVIGRHIFGLALDVDGDPLQLSGRSLIYQETGESQLIDYEEAKFQINAFDQLIGNIYLTKLTGAPLQVLDTSALDLSSVGGIVHPAGLVKTDWNSVLMLEQLTLDTRDSTTFLDQFKPYYKGNAELINVYNYGWISEIIVLDNSGKSKIIKNYALGRLSASELLIMPDNQTLYMLDKKASGNIYMFVSDKAHSFASGELFVLDYSSKIPRYISLGKSSALKMKFKLRKIKFVDIFDYAEPKNNVCTNGLSYIKTAYGEECLKLRKKNRKYAGLFEPVRYAALKTVTSQPLKVTSLRYDEVNNSLMLLTGKNKSLTFKLVPNEKMKSQYTIR